MYIMTVFLAVAGILDHLTHKIPNLLTALMLVFSLVIKTSGEGPAALPGVVLRMILTAGIFFPFFAIGTLGAGDVKLMSVMAGFFGKGRAAVFIFLALLIACAEGMILMLIRGQMKKRMLRLALYIKSFVKTGKAERYHACREAEAESGVALAGAMFISAVLGIGGLY